MTHRPSPFQKFSEKAKDDCSMHTYKESTKSNTQTIQKQGKIYKTYV
jgi:hypothetical protein